MKKNIVLMTGILALALVFTLSMTSCSGKSINSAEELKEYLNSQPANSPDKPIKVTMNVNDSTFESFADVIMSSDKYVSLNLSGSALTAIPDGAFFDENTFSYEDPDKGCKALVSITIPKSVTSIGDGAFAGCINLTGLTIPNSVAGIGVFAFDFCTSLMAINVNSGNTNYSSDKGVLYNKDKTTLIKYPSGKTGAFTVPKSVTEIGDVAFSNCAGLTGVTIPDSVTKIGHFAFMRCANLTSVTFQSVYDSIDFAHIFYSADPFPVGLLEKYIDGGIGTYTTTAPVNDDSIWTKK